MNKLSKPSLLVLYDRALKQFEKDREKLSDLYDDLKKLTVTAEDYSVNGQNLGKFGELLIKNTSQLIELVKVSHKENPESLDDLTEEDIAEAHAEIQKSFSTAKEVEEEDAGRD